MASTGKIVLEKVAEGSSPELELLLAAARYGATNERHELPVHPGLRWDELLRLAEFHGLEPLLAKTIRGADLNAPANFWQELNRNCAEIAGRNLALGRELLRVSAHMAASKIDYLVFKGPLLGVALFDTIALRPSRDIDLLVLPEQTEQAFAALREIGYVDKDSLDFRQRQASLRFGSEQCLAKSGIEVDLHWRLVPRLQSQALDAEGIWRRAVDAKLFDATLPTLSPEDNFIALCLHAGEHAWSQISHFSDLARLLRVTPNFNWDIVRSQTRDANTRRTVDVCMLLLSKYFDAGIPPDFLRREMQVELLAAHIATEFWVSPEKSPYYNDTNLKWVRERCRGLKLRDRMRWITGVLLTPSLADFQAIRLPVALQSLYPLTRLARLLFRTGRTGTA